MGSNDSLDGGLGIDTLAATLVGGTIVPTLTAIDTLDIANTVAVSTLDLSNSSGYTTLKNSGSTGGILTFNAISSTAPALSINNTALGTSFLYTTAAVEGTTDSVNLSLTNVTNAGVITIDGIETITVASNGVTANSVSLTAGSATTVNVNGSNAITLAGMAAATKIDGSTLTGALTATIARAGSLTGGSGADALTGSSGNDVLSGNDGNNTITAAAGTDTITTGVGNDRIEFATATNLTVLDSVNAGAGTNTLAVTAADIDTNAGLGVTADLAALARLTGIQIVEVTSAIGTATTDDINVAKMASSITTVTTTAAQTNTTAGVFTFNPGASTLNLGKGATSAVLVAAGNTFVASGTGTADTLSINKTGTAAEAVLATTSALTFTGFETVNIGSGALAGGAQNSGAIGITPTTTNAGVTFNVTGSAPQTLGVITPVGTGLITISGAGMTAQAAGTATLTIAAPVSTLGTVSITGSAGRDVLIGDIDNSNTIVGGDGVDTITGGSANDSLSGGTGIDTITTDAGVDNVDGGAGNDIIVVAANLTTADTINGGADNDTLSVTSARVATTLTYTNITGIEQVTVTDTLVNSVILSQVQAGITTVNLDGAQGANTITFDSGVAGTVASTLAPAASIVVASAGTGTADQITLTNLATANLFTGVNVTATGVETLVINTTSTTAGTAQSAATVTVTPTTLSGGQKLTLTGTSEIAITSATTTGTGLFTIDASNLSDADTPDTGFVLTLSGTSQGTAGTASITGSTGHDSITVGGFASTVVGGAGNDSIIGGSASDNLSSVAGENTITGSGGNDILTGGTGNDSITGASGRDNITGADGNDTLAGGGGNDTISAGAGNDGITETVTAADSINIDGGAGNDTLTLTGFNLLTAEDILSGGTETDTLSVAVVNATAGSGANVTGWETLVITTVGTAVQAMTTVLTADTSINRIDFTGAANALQGVSSASAALATLRAVDNSDATLTGTSGGLYVTRATNTTADSLIFGALFELGAAAYV